MISNIGPRGQRQRLLMGVAAGCGGLVLAVVLVLVGVEPGWLFVAAVPFWAGVLGLVEARDKT